MKTAIHLLDLQGFADLEYLRLLLDPDVRLTLGSDVPTDCEILVAGRPKREHLSVSPKLRSLVIPFAGLPESTRALLLDFPAITAHNIHYNAVPVAEMAITLLLAAAKCILPVDRAFRGHDWTSRYQPDSALLLEGSTVLILGYGAIGRRVAHICRALGMRVLATRRHIPSTEIDSEEQGIYPAEQLHQLLPLADALVICIPATSETQGLIGANELALLPSHAVLVNISRGVIVDEAALYQALHTRIIQAAGLDVWYNYPASSIDAVKVAPSAYPFHELENVIMSPHRAAHFRGSERLRMEHLAISLNEAAQGREMPYRVDLQAGY